MSTPGPGAPSVPFSQQGSAFGQQGQAFGRAQFGPPAAGPLAGLTRPLGSPGLIARIAQEQQDKATAYAGQAEDLRADAAGVVAHWTGAAATAFTGYAERLRTSVLRTALAHRLAAGHLSDWSVALESAQADYDQAEAIGVLASAQEQLAATESLSRMSAPPGTVFTGPAPPLISPLRAVARQQAEAAIRAADAAAEVCATALRSLTPVLETAPAKPQDDGWSPSDITHLALDGVGFIPVFGEPADLANAALYGLEGDTTMAALSAGGAVPFLGWGATGAKAGTKAARAAGKAGDEAAEAAVLAGKTEDEIRAAYETARLAAVPGDAALLSKAMEAAGLIRRPGFEAHHIVAAGAKDARATRDVLAKLGIDIDDAANGAFLPANRISEGAGLPNGPSTHRSLHTNTYHQAVRDVLLQAQTKEEAVEALQFLRKRLETGWAPR